jgi:hypothetical protein
MCLENYPECGDGGDGCCKRRLTIALECARRDTLGPIPRIWARRVDFQLYAVWTERNERRIADTIEACCAVCAKAEFIGKHFIVDKAEAELNRIYALDDPRPAAPREDWKVRHTLNLPRKIDAATVGRMPHRY